MTEPMFSNLTIRQLLTFREVMRSNSITQASRALGRTQPAVSALIATLEKQLALPLFVRDRGALVPTPEAHYFLEETNAVLERMERTAQTMSEFSKLERGSLRIACYPAGSSYFVPHLLSEFVAQRPDVHVDFMTRASQVIEDLIASQEFDIGLAITPEERSSILVESFTLECFVAVPADDPLTNEKSIHVPQLSGVPMAALYEEHDIAKSSEKAFADSGAVFNRRFTVRTLLPAIELVRSGACFAIVDGLTAKTTRNPGVAFRRLVPEINNNIALLRPAHRPPSLLAEAFADSLRTHLVEIAEAQSRSTA